MSDEDRKMDHKVVFEPYDMDTALGTNNSGVLMFSPYLEDTDTVSSVIAGGDSGGSEAPVYNAQDSVLWNNIRDAFRSELVQMYRTLRASNGPWQYNAIEKRFEDHQAKWPEAIFNEDAWVKYIIPLVDPVTVDEETGELIRTDRYLTMLQGSKKEQRKWWLYNRLRYLDSKYDTGNASANIINIRFFNGGVLKLKTAIPMYAAVSFGGGTTPEIKRTEANTEVSFTYTPGTGVTEMETWIHSGNLITDVGDLSVFYPNECDFSKASLLRRLKIGDATAGYSNANLTTINVRNSPLLESIDCRNCPRLNITVNLENSPRLAEAYFDGTTITGLDLADGCAIETLHLPATVTALTLLNLTKLQEFYIPSYANVARLMMSNIDYEVVNPVTVLESIHSNAQVNIQGLYLELDDAEAIGEFFDLLDTMTGVTRERSAVTGEWIYHDAEKAVVSGEVHTFSLTGEEMEALNSRYPYVRTTADHISTTLKYYNYDGSVLLESETILDGTDGTYSGTPARADDADWRYTFIGWNTQPDKYVADADATKSVTRNRSVYAAYSRTSIAVLKYYTYDGSELLYSETIIGGGNGTYTGQPTRAADARYTYTFAGWATVANGQADSNALKNVTTHKSVYAAYTAEGQKYTVTFKSEGGTVLQTVNNVLYGGTAIFTGTVPAKTGVTDPEMYEFNGWNPSNQGITGNTECYPTYKYIGIVTRKFITRQINSAYSNSTVSFVGQYAFCSTYINSLELTGATYADDYAFAGMSLLSNISIPNVSYIGYYAFVSCSSLSSISLPEVTSLSGTFYNNIYIKSYYTPKLKIIGDHTFDGAGIKNVDLSNFGLVEEVGYAAFRGTRIRQAFLPRVSYIAREAFNTCTILEEVSAPLAEYVSKWAFATCSKLSNITIPNVKTILESAFYKCYNISSIVLDNVEKIGAFAFEMCVNLTDVNLPKVSSIDNNPFLSCYNLETIRLGSISYISYYLCNDCVNLQALILETESVVGIPTASYIVSNANSLFKIYVPSSLYSDYLSSTCWSLFSSVIHPIGDLPSVFPKNIITDIETQRAQIPPNTSSRRMYNGISDSTATEISSAYRFSGFHALQFADIPNLSIVYSSTFQSCYALRSVNMPNVTDIKNAAFYSCYALSEISFPRLSILRNNVFGGCTLKKISLPMVSVLENGWSAGFQYVESMAFPALPSISSQFNNLYQVRVLDFTSVSNINGTAFSYCSQLEKVILRSSGVVSINAQAMYNLPNDAVFCVPSGLVAQYRNYYTHWTSMFVPIEEEVT